MRLPRLALLAAVALCGSPPNDQLAEGTHGDMPLQLAVQAPRIHHQWQPESLSWELNALSLDARERLAEMGHRFDAEPIVIGRCQAIEVRPDGTRVAVSDPRSGGTAAAW